MKKIDKAFREIAKKNNTTVKNVKKEIMLSIETAMENNSPENIKLLKSMSATGTVPTPEEVIIYFCNNLILSPQ